MPPSVPPPDLPLRRHALLATAAVAAVCMLDFAHPSRPLILQGAGPGLAAMPLAGFAAPVIPPHLSPNRLSPPAEASDNLNSSARHTSATPAEVFGDAPQVPKPPTAQASIQAPANFAEVRRLFEGEGAEAIPALRAFVGGDAAPQDVARTRYLLGLALLRQGRGLEARAEWSLAAPLLAAMGDDLRYHMAEATFVAGHLLTARKSFLRFIAQHADSPWAPRARFRIADIDFILGDWPGSQAQYEELLLRYPEYPNIALTQFAIARCLEERGHKREAAGRYRDLRIAMRDPAVARRAGGALERLETQGIRPRSLSWSQRLEWGKSLSYWKRWKDAEDFLGPLVEDLRNARRPGERLREAHFARGQNHYAWERFADALTDLRAAQDAGIGDKVLVWLARTYERLGQPDAAAGIYAQYMGGHKLQDKLQDMYFDEGRYDLARAHLQRLLELRPRLMRSFKYRWRMAWLDYRQGRLDAAAQAFEAMGTSRTRHRWQATYWLGRTLARQGKIDEARDAYAAITAKVTSNYYALQADNRIRDLDRQVEPKPEAAPVAAYGGGLPLAPLDGRSPWARRPMSRTSVTASNRRLVDSLGDRPNTTPPPSLPLGRSLATSGTEAPTAAPSDRRPSPDRPTLEVSGEDIPDLDVRPFGPGIPASTAFQRLVDRYGELLPRLARAQEMATLGRWWQVRRDLEAALHEVREVRRNGSGLAARIRSALGGSFIDHRAEDRGAWGASLDAAALPAKLKIVDRSRRRKLAKLRGRFYRDLGAAFHYAGAAHYAKKYILLGDEHRRGVPDGPPEQRSLWARAYPKAFEDLVVRHSQEHGLSPELMWAVMTVESSHYPAAVSRANARGLMQVIPKTGYLVGRLMGLRGWSAAKLSEPEVAIRFGCWYMAQLMKKFRGQEPLAIAAYNGGPHNVAYWLKRKGDLAMDEFVEEMRFTQARGYTKKVLKFLRLYRRIYKDTRALYVSNDLNPAYRNNINF